MSSNLTKLEEAYTILKDYKGDNPYIIMLKNGVYAYKDTTLNDFQVDFILKNKDFGPIFIQKNVRIADWWAEKQQVKYNLPFIPKLLEIGYYMGESNGLYVFYARYRKSQEKGFLTIAPKNAILTDFLSPDWHNMEIDFTPYNERSGLILKPHQEDAVKFMLTRKKCVLALLMGRGKSVAAIVAALEGKFKKVLIISPASIKSTWKKELNYFVDDDEITIVEGKNWKESKFTIINYDILDNFYELPTEVVKKRVKDVNDKGQIVYKYVEKTIVSKKSSIINAAMESSQLFQSKFDCIIIDEAHRLSNSTSNQYKLISDLVKRSNPEALFELTGTMITNSPMNLYNMLKPLDLDITKDWQAYVNRYCDAKQFRNKSDRDKFTKLFLQRKGRASWYDLTSLEKDELDSYLDKNCRKIWQTSGASHLDELSERIKHIYFREAGGDSVINVKKEVKVIDYELNPEERAIYQKAWGDFVDSKGGDAEAVESLVKNQSLIEGSVLRQVTAKLMLDRTYELAMKHINKGEKVIIACNFDEEVYNLKERFGDSAVIYNGKMTAKQKDAAKDKFMADDSCMVFIGNMKAAAMGLTLIKSHVMIFNSVSFTPSDNNQMEYRIIRLGQDNDCIIYYQNLLETYTGRMFEILNIKNAIINEVIK